MYRLTIRNLKEVDDKIVIICALLAQRTRYLDQAQQIADLKSERVEVQKMVESYRDDAARITTILEQVYNARTELQPTDVHQLHVQRGEDGAHEACSGCRKTRNDNA